MKSLYACCAALALSACSSAPIQFYTLVKPQTQNTRASEALAIEVLPVSVPSQVDVPQIVLREGAGQLALVENQQWIAPLAHEIRAALASELATQLGARDLSGATRPAGMAVYRVQLDVRRFDSSLGNGAAVEALWTLRAPRQATPALLCNARIEEPARGSYAALVESHQRALSRIASQIAAAIRTQQAGQPAQCPD